MARVRKKDLPTQVNGLDTPDETLEQLDDEYVSGAVMREQLETFTTPPRTFASWRDKLAVAVLAVVGVSALALWSTQMVRSLNVGQQLSAEELAQLAGKGNSSSVAALRSQDTDNDELSDYDELYVHQTSPYLDDSDSDGATDQQEILAGEDPNCPRGRQCATPETNVGSASNATTSPTMVFEPTESDVTNVLGGETDAQALRAFLLQAGMNKELLEKIDDETLMQTYQKTIEEGPPPPTLETDAP